MEAIKHTVYVNPKMTLAEWESVLQNLINKYGSRATLSAESDDPFCGTELIIYVTK